ncbi:zinc finger and SCAN domain containing protein 4F-like [Rattus norvegicus]|uniref:zinc finger and SCAN domain containing protein 4F-like n=1 Tax=Rattus norvegicus TaxID=10116 RepID=UPI00001C9D4C|nr:zinc finger and SCAN domain containing protein 4F-like [Rattus norvegicus]
MASEIKEALKHKTAAKYLQKDNLEFIPTHASPVQWGEIFSDSSSAQLNFSPSKNGFSAKQELQKLWQMFNSWLQPEKQSKEQMISQLVLEQFLLTGHCKDNFVLKEIWEASGRNMGRFLEGLTDECLKPPAMVYVSMQGLEAQFSENMPLKEVIKILEQQKLATGLTPESTQMPVHIAEDILLATGQENSENKHTSGNSTEVNIGDSSTGHEMNSLLIIQKEQCPEQEDGLDSFQFTQGARASQGNSSHHVEFLSAHTWRDIPMEAQPVIFYRTNISEDREECCTTSKNATQENSADNIPMRKMDSVFINQRMYHPEPKMGDVSCGVPQGFTRSPGTSTSQQESLGLTFSEDDPRDIPGVPSRPEKLSSEAVLLYQNQEANSTSKSHQKRLHVGPKQYNCEECPRTFKYASHLSLHQRTHQNKKAFVCPTCQKTFKRASDLRCHEIIHNPEKPFKCSTCEKSFSHKTNLKAHERIHTGEKPYVCSLCSHRFCQSSTYNRHLRNVHKSD